MYLSLPMIVAWFVVTGLYVALSFYRRRQISKKMALIRNQRRTIEKLKKENGKIWYDIARNEESQLNEVELTLTNR
jgi:hypothetical protein